MSEDETAAARAPARGQRHALVRRKRQSRAWQICHGLSLQRIEGENAQRCLGL
jgi:hypothetical protein